MHIWVLAYFLGYRGSYDGRAIDSSVLTDFMIHPSIFTVYRLHQSLHAD